MLIISLSGRKFSFLTRTIFGNRRLHSLLKFGFVLENEALSNGQIKSAIFGNSSAIVLLVISRKIFVLFSPT